MNLFVRPPENLLDYTPKFSTEETCLFYRFAKIEVLHGLCSFDENPEPEYSYQHSITILDEVIYGQNREAYSYYQQDKFDISAEIANEYLASRHCKPQIKEWLMANAAQLNDDKRYWKARYHRKEIEDTEVKIEELQEKVRQAWIVQSMYAYEVKQRRRLTREERTLLLTEFQGEPWTQP
jgi:hypothetical protein